MKFAELREMGPCTAKYKGEYLNFSVVLFIAANNRLMISTWTTDESTIKKLNSISDLKETDIEFYPEAGQGKGKLICHKVKKPMKGKKIDTRIAEYYFIAHKNEEGRLWGWGEVK